MIEKNEGLTKIYNRFNNPQETSDEILKLRVLQQQMDSAVLSCYGWQDIHLNYDFYNIEDEEDDENLSVQKDNKKCRYKLSPDIQDEILGRLLKLNQERYDEEVRLGLHKKK